VPTVEARRAVVERFAADLRPLGPANFIYADGELLFAHGHRRTQADGERRPPGLHVSERACTCDGGASQRVVLFASVPLSDGGWRPFEDGELIVARRGEVLSPRTIDRPTDAPLLQA
jgi:glutamine amidotransferase